MPIRSAAFSPIPADTAQAAQAVFGKGNLYLTIGDQVGLLLDRVKLADLNRSGNAPGSSAVLFALVTIFQSMEDLPDRQAAQAVRVRTDWKYALHLPLDYPGFDRQMLCDFRRGQLFDAAGRQVLQYMLARLAEAGLLGSRDKRRIDAASILMAVCTLSRLEGLAGALRLAVESLATYRPDWLQAIALPHWYARYGRPLATFPLPHTAEEQERLAQEIGGDAAYLLETVQQNTDPGLAGIPEIQALREIWRRNFDLSEELIKWRSPYCAGCGGRQ